MIHHHEKKHHIGRISFTFVQACFQQMQDNPIGGRLISSWFSRLAAGDGSPVFLQQFWGWESQSLATGWWEGNWWVSFGWLSWGLGKSVVLERFVNRGWLPGPNVGILMEVRFECTKDADFTQNKYKNE